MAFIQTDVRDNVLVITLNRPEARNAFNLAMAAEMEAVIDSYEADKSLRCAIIQAEGTTFSAGQDLKEAAQGKRAMTERRGGFGIFRKPPEKPLIAAVEGQALAGGMELTLCCDIVVASRNSVFGLAEAKRGLVALGGGCFRLARRIPYNVAMEMLLTAQTRTAEEMRALGYVARVVEPGDALDTSLEIAAGIAVNAPLAVRASKAILQRAEAECWSEEQAWVRQLEVVAPVLASHDLQEGLRAFAEKRDAVWTGA